MYQLIKKVPAGVGVFTRKQRKDAFQYTIARIACLALSLVFVSGMVTHSWADVPLLRNPAAQIDKQDLSGLPRLRFLTTLDFPPFNFADSTKKPTGFNVDLARAICTELAIEQKCEIQALPWDELEGALQNGRGEAIIAGTAVTAQKRTQFAMTPSYFRFPARFIGQVEAQDQAQADIDTLFAGKSVAVVEASAHAAMLEAFFPDAVPVPVNNEIAAYEALGNATADYIFGDGVGLGFYITSPAASGCCDFVGGPYYNARFLGEGMGVVMRKADARLLKAIESALIETMRSGIYADIFARYFPRSPYE